MRRVRVCLVALLLASLGGCKGDTGGAEAAAGAGAEVAPAAVDSELTDEERELLARRDALLNTRRELHTRRAALAEKRAELAASGGDVSEVDEKVSQLAQDERELAEKEAELETNFDEILGKRLRATLEGAGTTAAAMAAREASLAAREKAFARREERLAARERQLAEREVSLADKWKDTCTTSVPTTTTIVQTVKGSKYTKQDVEPLLRRARRDMSKKGILVSDLPVQARDLEGEATKAMAEGDYGRARLAAAQLSGTVRAIKVDKAFVSGKWARLNRAMKGKRLTDDQSQLLSAAAASIADGKFANANRQLNRLFASAK